MGVQYFSGIAHYKAWALKRHVSNPVHGYLFDKNRQGCASRVKNSDHKIENTACCLLDLVEEEFSPFSPIFFYPIRYKPSLSYSISIPHSLTFSVPPALFTASINQFASDEVKNKLSIFYLDEQGEETNQNDDVTDKR